jgi:hypothetical protein
LTTLSSPISEPVILRLLLALVILRHALPRTFVFSKQHCSVGLARLVDLSVFGRPSVYRGLRGLAILNLLLYVGDFNGTAALAYLAVFCLLYQTLRNSQGGVVHVSQALALVLFFQLWNAVDGSGSYQRGFFWCQQVVVAVYFTAGVTKILKSGWVWVQDSPNIALQFIKASKQQYYSTGEIRRLAPIRGLAEWLFQNPGYCRVLLFSGLLLELISPLFLLNRWTGMVGGSFLLLFHVAIWHSMRIQFACLACLMTIFLFDLPGLLVRAIS